MRQAVLVLSSCADEAGGADKLNRFGCWSFLRHGVSRTSTDLKHPLEAIWVTNSV
jgi:hypothetical protein